jgi:hypothetical protein
MKVYQVISETSEVPLAEIRTDGNAVDFVVDNTEGQLPADVKNSFARLKQIVRSSHHMTLREPKGPTVNLLRYVLDNGDVIEITTDGSTCMLNGQLLDEAQKKSLYNAIRSRQLNVSARPSEPVPVMPTPEQKGEQQVEVGHRSASVVALLSEMNRKQEDLEATYGPHGDSGIDGRDYSYSDSPEDSRQLAYFLKYGTGGRRAEG